MLRRCHGGQLVCQLAIAERSFRRLMNHLSGRRRQLRLRNAPRLGGGRDHHRARGRADLAHWIPRLRDRGAAAGRLVRIFRGVEIRLFHPHIFPIDVQFVSNDHGKGSLHSLADLRILRHDCDNAVGTDANKRVGNRNYARRRSLSKDRGLEVEAEQHAAAADGAGL